MLELAIASTLLLVSPAAADLGARKVRLLPLTREQVVQAGAAGAGCSWSLPGEERPRFAVADDRAVVRLASRMVTLSPGRDARDLAPFTFDLWAAESITIRIVPTGRSRHLGGSVTDTPANLEIRVGGSTRWLAGVLSCGS